jgi:hypothetical protein
LIHHRAGGRRGSRQGDPAATVAEWSRLAFATAAQIDQLSLVDLKTQRLTMLSTVGFVTKWQMLRLAAGASIVNPRVEGECNRHSGISVGAAHHPVLSVLIENLPATPPTGPLLSCHNTLLATPASPVSKLFWIIFLKLTFVLR